MSFEDTMKNHGSHLVVGLTIEDDFVLTRLKNRAISLEGKARDQYMWKVIYNFVCRERAYKSVLEELDVAIDTNIDIFQEEPND